MVTPGQIRAARSLLGLSQAEVALRAGLSVPTVKRAESEMQSVSRRALAAICRVLEDAGIRFVPEDGDGAGVRLRKHSTQEGIRPDQLTSANDD